MQWPFALQASLPNSACVSVVFFCVSCTTCALSFYDGAIDSVAWYAALDAVFAAVSAEFIRASADQHYVCMCMLVSSDSLLQKLSAVQVWSREVV